MAETPTDIIARHIAAERDRVESGNGSFDVTDTTVAINEELKEKFTFIPNEEIAAVEIEDSGKTHGASLTAGSGPETIRANAASNPNWLYNSAVNALAMQRHLLRGGGPVEATKADWKLVEENRTAPVLPPHVVTPGWDAGHVEIKIRVTGNPMLWYMGTDLQPYRLDTLTPGDRVPLRERQIAMALLDLSAKTLRDQTL